MKIKLLTAISGTGAMLATLITTNADAQVSFGGSLTAPVIGASDQYFLGGAGSDTNNLDGSAVLAGNYTGDNDQDTYVAADKTAQGQTFTAGSNAQGYSLNSFTFQHVNYVNNGIFNGTYWNVPNGSTLQYAIGIDNGGVLTQLAGGTTAGYSGASISGGSNNLPYGAGTGTYFTFGLSGLNLTLAANTTYYFELASTSDYLELNGLGGASVAGAEAFSGGTTAATDTANNADNGERTFDASLTAVPEPGTVALMGVAGLLGLFTYRGRK
jgi:PEP-CTERM motif